MWAPERDEHGDYGCRIEIDIPGEESVRFTAGGADAFQAVTFALRRIPMELERFEESGELSSEGVYGHWFPPILVRATDTIPAPDWPRRTPISIRDTWAERVLEFAPNDGGELRRMFVKLGRPYTQPGMAGSWSVEFEVREGMETPMRAHAVGEDSFQALDMALQQIAIVLGPYEEHGKITWNGHPGHGFRKPDLEDDSEQRHPHNPDTDNEA